MNAFLHGIIDLGNFYWTILNAFLHEIIDLGGSTAPFVMHFYTGLLTLGVLLHHFRVRVIDSDLNWFVRGRLRTRRVLGLNNSGGLGTGHRVLIGPAVRTAMRNVSGSDMIYLYSTINRVSKRGDSGVRKVTGVCVP